MEVAQEVTGRISGAGADRAACRYTVTERQELNAEWDEVSLLRSTTDHAFRLVAMTDGKRATLSGNQLDEASLAQSVDAVVAQAQASKADDANDIAPPSEARTFESGRMQPDLDAMHDRLAEFLAWRKATFPKVSLRGAHFEFSRSQTAFANSNGVDLRSSTGFYQFVAIFSAKQGADVSSFNYSVWQGTDLDRPLSETGSFERLLAQSEEQITTRQVPNKFRGDVIITPDCLGSFLAPVCTYLRDSAMIAGTSVFQDALGSAIADPKLTVRTCPVSAPSPDHITSDGYVAQDDTLIENGVLKSYLLSLYGANKTGRDRAANDGSCFVVEPGTPSFDELVSSIDEGVLLCRFSGGRPADNGDFSGIAKNSYYIEGGQVKYPLSETMVSGNLVSMLGQIAGVSREQVDFGFARMPWIQVQGLTIS